jgi:hypothetical protein
VARRPSVSPFDASLGDGMSTQQPGDDPTLEFPVPVPVGGTGSHPPPPPPPRPAVVQARPRNNGCPVAVAIVALAVLLVVLLAVVLLAAAADDADDQRAREAADVDLAGCSTNGVGHMAAGVTVTNQSSKRSTYLIDVALESPDGARQLATLPIVVKGLEPGQVKEQEASTLTAPSGEFECRVSKVERLADEP